MAFWPPARAEAHCFVSALYVFAAAILQHMETSTVTQHTSVAALRMGDSSRLAGQWWDSSVQLEMLGLLQVRHPMHTGTRRCICCRNFPD